MIKFIKSCYTSPAEESRGREQERAERFNYLMEIINKLAARKLKRRPK